MKKRVFKSIICTMMTMIILLGSMIPASAATTLSKNLSSQDAFAVPTGGYSICTYDVTLSEDYSYNTSTKQNVFSRHSKIYLYKMTYSTTKPSLNVGNIVHYDGSGNKIVTFGSYNNLVIMYDSTKFDLGVGYYNPNLRTYPTTTSNYSFLAFDVYCSGAAVPTKAHTLKLPLATK